MKPTETPWGPSQHQYEHAEGLVFHSTASHGGCQLSPQRQVELHEIEAFKPFGPEWLEEDCDAALVALRWPGFATDEAIADAILTARQVASWEHSAAKWKPVVEWLDTMSLQGPYAHNNRQGNETVEFLDTMHLQERADRHHKTVKHLWQRGSMSTHGRGWQVSFRRGDERRTVSMDYPTKRYYSDEELACGGKECCGCKVCTQVEAYHGQMARITR